LDKKTFTDLKQKTGVYSEYLEAFQKNLLNAKAQEAEKAVEQIKTDALPISTNPDGSNVVHLPSRDTASITCPSCGSIQMSNRNNCFKCGIGFVFDSETITNKS
jgi:hypothetical protein